MTGPEESEHERQYAVLPGKDKRAPFRTGWYVVVTLLALTWLEYLVAVVMPSRNLPIMVAMNVADAAAIMYYFMHVTRAWRSHGEGH